MKARLGFVSNSSSSSFCIARKDITKHQFKMIRDHVKHWEEVTGYIDKDFLEGNAWRIEVRGRFIEGSTDMDNLNMRKYLDAIGVDAAKVKWEWS